MSTTSVNKLSQLISTAVASYAIHLNKNDLKGTLTNTADFANFISTQADQFVKQYDSGDQFQNVAFNGFSAIYASKVPFAYLDSLDQEKSLLTKAEHEKKSATEILAKLEQTLPTYKKAADAYARLEKEGFFGNLATADKQREALEKAKDLDAQQATVAALQATIAAQQKKISQIQSTYQSELQKELADVRARIAQLQPNLDKTAYKEGLMELRAPQDGTIKDLATTTIGAVVQPGTVVLTLVPKDEHLYADVQIKNEDVGFVQIGQHAQIKLAAYPFQRYGMLKGTVIHLSADATETGKSNATNGNSSSGTLNSGTADNPNSASTIATYKARVQLDQQILIDAQGNKLAITPGMQVVAEINQGKRSVLEYLLSPVQKAVSEAGRER